MRVANPKWGYIGYRLNILGIRVWRDRCQLVAKDHSGIWSPIGPARPLPLHVPDDPRRIESDPLLLTAYQYDREQPGSDLVAVLAQEKPFEEALSAKPDGPIRDHAAADV